MSTNLRVPFFFEGSAGGKELKAYSRTRWACSIPPVKMCNVHYNKKKQVVYRPKRMFSMVVREHLFTVPSIRSSFTLSLYRLCASGQKFSNTLHSTTGKCENVIHTAHTHTLNLYENVTEIPFAGELWSNTMNAWSSALFAMHTTTTNTTPNECVYVCKTFLVVVDFCIICVEYACPIIILRLIVKFTGTKCVWAFHWNSEFQNCSVCHQDKSTAYKWMFQVIVLHFLFISIQ